MKKTKQTETKKKEQELKRQRDEYYKSLGMGSYEQALAGFKGFLNIK